MQDLSGVVEQERAFLSQMHETRRSIEQDRADFLFEPGQSAAYSRWCESKVLRGRGNRARIDKLTTTAKSPEATFIG